MVDSEPVVVPVQRAMVKPFDLAVAYPRPDTVSVGSRIRQLRKLGVTSLIFEGPLKLDRISLLGKGVAATVVAGVIRGEKIALKIRRVDSRRKDMFHESEMLQLANHAGVGPKHIAVTDDVLAMEFASGQRLPMWLAGVKGRGQRKRVRSVIKQLLEQCRALDSAGLDHGELSRAHKNVLVGEDGSAWILDFESASSERRPKNFTSLTQYLFLGGGMTRRMARILGPSDRLKLMRGLKDYKEGDISGLETVFQSLKL